MGAYTGRGLSGLVFLIWATHQAAAGGFLPQNTTWQVGSGVDLSSGKYGAASNTDVVSIPFDVRAQFDRLRLSLSVAYLNVTGPGTYVGGVVVGAGPAASQSGLGDTYAGAAFLLSRDGDFFPAIEVENIVKLPTADDGLGTGETDNTLQLNLHHSFTPRLMLFASVGYQWLSDSPAVALEDGVLASAGLNFKPSATTSIGFSGAYRQEYFAGLGHQLSVSPYLLWNFSETWRVCMYGTVGATDASPEYGGGFRLIFSD